MVKANGDNKVDEAYKNATQSVVDDTMRVDVLGPHMVNVFKNHTPAFEAVVDMLKKAIEKEPAIKDEIEKVINSHDSKRKIKLLDRFTGGLAGFGIAIALIIIGAIVNHFIK